MSDKLLSDYMEGQYDALAATERQVVLRGHLNDHHDLYPDIEIKTGHISYARSTTPLPFLLLMYDKVAVFIPPLGKAELEERFALSIDAVFQLIEADLIQPIIAEPSQYAGSELRYLLECKAPSVLARGVYLLEKLSLSDTLSEQACPLPISQMARIPVLQERYARRFPAASASQLDDIVKNDLLLNYADLCVFGHREVADGLLRYGSPERIAEILYKTNEILIYPKLFGFGGTANYDLRSVEGDPELVPLVKEHFSEVDFSFSREELDLFLRGIGVTVSGLDAEKIIEFHASGDGAKLRRASEVFEAEVREKLHGRAPDNEHLIAVSETLRARMLEASKELSSPKFRRATRKKEKTLDIVFRGASLAVGALIGHHLTGTFVGMVGGGAILNQVFLPLLKDRMMDQARELIMHPGLANLWSIRRK